MALREKLNELGEVQGLLCQEKGMQVVTKTFYPHIFTDVRIGVIPITKGTLLKCLWVPWFFSQT